MPIEVRKYVPLHFKKPLLVTCGTVSSMLSGLKTRSLGLNTLASSQSVQVGRPSTASWVQPVLSKVNVTCSRPQRNVHRPGFEPGTPWSEIRRPNHCATPPPSLLVTGIVLTRAFIIVCFVSFFRYSEPEIIVKYLSLIWR